MHRSTCELAVDTPNGNIRIQAPDGSPMVEDKTTTAAVLLSPDIVDTLIVWLKEAQGELQGQIETPH